MSDDKPFAIPAFELDKVPANLEELENNKQQIQRRIPKWMGFWKDCLFKMYVIETASWEIVVSLPRNIRWLAGLRDKLYGLVCKIKLDPYNHHIISDSLDEVWLLVLGQGKFLNHSWHNTKYCWPWVNIFIARRMHQIHKRMNIWWIFHLQGCNLDHGYLCGIMESLNDPSTVL